LLAFKAASIIPLQGRRISDIQSFLLAAVVWGATVALGLWITKSDLLSALRRKKLPST